MQITHVKSNTVADATGTVTFWNGTTTGSIAATNAVRPSDWNSQHALQFTLAGNTTGNSTVSGTNVIFNGAGGISIGGSNGSLMISGPSGAGGVTHSFYNEFKEAPLVAGQIGNGSLHIQRWAGVPHLTMDRVVMPVLFSGATNSTGTMTVSFHVGVYTKNVSTLSLLQSSSWTTAVTHSGTANSTLNSGMRIVSFGWSTSLADGDYFIGVLSRTTSGGANMTLSQMVNSQINSAFSGYLGSVTSASVQMSLGHGLWSTTSTALPGSVAIGDLRATTSVNLRPPSILFGFGTA